MKAHEGQAGTIVRSAFVALFLSTSVAALAQVIAPPSVSPPHQSRLPLNQYIDPAELTGDVCDLGDTATDCAKKLHDESTRYFKSVGVYDSIDANGIGHPSADRGTFKAWKQRFEFAVDATTAVAPEIRAAYFNNGDLQFGRDMHCRSHTNTGPTGAISSITHACYVSNFTSDTSTAGLNKPGPVFDPAVDPTRSADDAALAIHPIATVAMEVDAFLSGGDRSGGLRFERFGDVRFLAYVGDGTPFQEPALDSENVKAIPGLCMACHGGTYVSAVKPGGPKVAKGNFLPFDTSNYFLPTSGKLRDGAGRPLDLNEQFRKLNSFVRSTQPPRQTITDLIDGWYTWCGGVQTSGCAIDNMNVNHAFVPSGPCPASDVNGEKTCGWSDSNNATFYTEVVAKYCRSCHVALSEHFNVQNFSTWKSGQGGNAAPIAVQTNHRMPYAEVPYVLFQRNTQGPSGKGARDFFDAFFAGKALVNKDEICGNANDGQTASCPSGTSCGPRTTISGQRSFWCAVFGINCPVTLTSTDFFCDAP
jgi:hypothetical protein